MKRKSSCSCEFWFKIRNPPPKTSVGTWVSLAMKVLQLFILDFVIIYKSIKFNWHYLSVTQKMEMVSWSMKILQQSEVGVKRMVTLSLLLILMEITMMTGFVAMQMEVFVPSTTHSYSVVSQLQQIPLLEQICRVWTQKSPPWRKCW